MLSQLNKLIKLFICPNCAGDLVVNKNFISCQKCGKKFAVKDNIPLLFELDDDVNQEVTEKVKTFYEETPFPNYEGFETVADLASLAKVSIFAKLLHEQIPYNMTVLEVGCGTGQLTNFLGSSQREVLGVDMSFSSLKLGQQFKEKNDLSRVGFYQMNIFKPIFKEESFDYVICNGVLHHTADPYLGWQKISHLVKKDGYILIGLYNRYGRLLTDARRIIMNLFGEDFRFLDAKLRDSRGGKVKKDTWYLDQYKNPHESKHTVEEMMAWFKQNGFEFINSIPSVKIYDSLSDDTQLFKQIDQVSPWETLISQLMQIPSGAKEGGLFIMIGKRIL